MKKGALKLVLLGWIGLLAAACGHLPATHYYMLAPRPGEGSSAATSPDRKGLRIGISDFRIDPPFDQDRIVYRAGQGEVQVGFYAYHRWAVPLSRMLPRLAAGELGTSRGVALMEPAVGGRVYDALLQGRLLSLEEIDGGEAGIQASFRLQLSLTSQSGDLLWSGMLTGDMAVPETREVEKIVTAMQEVLQKAMGDVRPRFEAAVSATLARLDGSPVTSGGD